MFQQLTKWFRGNTQVRRSPIRRSSSFGRKSRHWRIGNCCRPAMSNLGGIQAQFQLNNQQLVETVNQKQTIINNVQGLFQGQDAAGHQVVYDWAGGNLNEFTGTGWQSIGAADYVLARRGGRRVFHGEGHAGDGDRNACQRLRARLPC